MNKPDMILVANSPGELSALVKPVAEELAKKGSFRVILVLTPCQYTSGKEIEFSRSIPGIAEIVSAAEYKKWAIFNQKPKRLTFSTKGAVLFLGGDLSHAIIIARKLKYPAFAYLNERIAWKKAYREFFVADQLSFHKFSRQVSAVKLKVTGNLMVDSVRELPKWAPEENVLTFMPGSRKWEIDYMTPFYKKVMELIRKTSREIKFQVVSSPFVKAHPIDGAKMVEFEKIHNSELVVTIPGTNTAKIAARGIPLVVVFPLNNPEVIPMDGLAEIIGNIPIMGKAFKKAAANLINNKTKYFALPNQKAGRMIAPEIRGQIEPLTVALKILLLLHDREEREKMSRQLIESMGKAGAARMIVEEISAAI